MIDAESIYLTDTDGADILIQVAEELAAQGTSLVLAPCIRRCSSSGSAPA